MLYRYCWRDYGELPRLQPMLLIALILLAGCDIETSEISDSDSMSAKNSSSAEPSASSIPPDDIGPTSLLSDEALQETAAEPNFYTVEQYDLQADPAQQLQTTLARAKAEQKTVLLQVGGDWCSWCKLMTEFMDENEAVNQRLGASYLIQKVTYDSANRNEEFLGNYPSISGYPHLFVLDANGNLLHSQNTAELEEGRGYNEQAFVGFLNQWKPK